jgi:phosphonate transport system substrate-binding protein
MRISAIPDQDPHELASREKALAEYLSNELRVDVEYVPLIDYAASVTLFRAGELDLVFYGGLTGVQARLQAPGASVLAQRDVDARFRSVFIANSATKLGPINAVSDLVVLAGTRFTFGSESSTSGRLMPEYFLRQAGLDSERDFTGDPGYSGSHDSTIDLVEAGSYEVGALNLQVWRARHEAGTVDTTKVVELFRTPAYHDYHWIAGPETDARFGEGFTDEIGMALIGLDNRDPAEAAVLEAYGAREIIPSTASNYQQITQIARDLNLIP